ncbi:EVE domain-containing protein [Streptomyces sp. NPDC016566]|uniref:EVE domain-containing protein n=1 Tax=unclassified Streptomyces TaxID=2593676 RepID=UPI0011A6AAA2|nr:EVE domain-containing protein [Streptomyces sp. BK340]TVZ80780.1 EVE domain-containing protein [Streptomyces sp. BK340]
MNSHPTLFSTEGEDLSRNASGSPGRAWLGVVSAEHARHASRHGWIQLNHGDRRNLARMRRGDGFVFYSPTERMGDRARLRAFTALGVIADDEPHLADEVMNMGARGTVRPWRRTVDFEDVHAADLRTVAADLLLTRQPNWGYGLRLGLVPLAVEDFELLRVAMGR